MARVVNCYIEALDQVAQGPIHTHITEFSLQRSRVTSPGPCRKSRGVLSSVVPTVRYHNFKQHTVAKCFSLKEACAVCLFQQNIKVGETQASLFTQLSKNRCYQKLLRVLWFKIKKTRWFRTSKTCSKCYLLSMPTMYVTWILIMWVVFKFLYVKIQWKMHWGQWSLLSAGNWTGAWAHVVKPCTLGYSIYCRLQICLLLWLPGHLGWLVNI